MSAVLGTRVGTTLTAASRAIAPAQSSEIEYPAATARRRVDPPVARGAFGSMNGESLMPSPSALRAIPLRGRLRDRALYGDLIGVKPIAQMTV